MQMQKAGAATLRPLALHSWTLRVHDLSSEEVPTTASGPAVTFVRSEFGATRRAAIVTF
ncbi:hypothetical protein AB7M37_004939 [Sinorhizobium fredii]